MAFNFNNIIFNELIATNSTNYHNPTELEMNDGILPNTQLNSELVNSFLYKCSAAIKNIQENGAINYIPGKTYYPGNIVVCQVVSLDYMTTNVFRCKKECTNEAPLADMVNNDSNGFIYFNESAINTDYWDKVFVNSISNEDILIEEFNKIGTEVRDTDFKYIELFDPNILLNNPNQKATFRLTIKRDDSFLSTNVNVTIVDSKIKVNILDLYCNKYNLDSSTSIFNPDSKFKDFALLGCFLSIDPATNKLNLVMCPRAGSIPVADKYINVNLSQISGSLKCRLKDIGDTGAVLLNSIIKVPFVNGCSSEFNKSIELFDSFEKLDYKEKFIRGLVLLDGQTQADDIVYSCLYLNRNKSGVNFDSYYDNYTSIIKKQNYLANDILQEKIDKVTDIPAQYTGVIINYHPSTVLNNKYDYSNGMFSEQLATDLGVERFFVWDAGTQINIGKTNFDNSSGGGNSKGCKFDASLSNSTYTDTIQDKFLMNSTKIYKYMYFI